MAKKPIPVVVTPQPTRKIGERCDCLNDCGDDTWVRDGRAVPCDRFAAVRYNEQLRARLAEVRDKYRLELAQNPEREQFTVTRFDLEALVSNFR